jgi:PAS domain S-box-containing protein
MPPEYAKKRHSAHLPEDAGGRDSLSPSGTHYRRLIEAANDAIFQLDRSGNYLYMNEAGARRLGVQKEAMIGRNVRDFFPIEAASMLDPLDSVFSTGQGVSVLRRITIQQKPVDFSAVLVPLKSREGVVESVVVIARDVSWIRTLIAAAKTNQRRIRELFTNMGEGVGIVDAEERFRFVNPAAHAIFGVSAGQLKNRNLREFVTEEGWQQILRESLQRRRGLRNSYQLDIIRPDGERRVLQVTATARHSRSGSYLGAFGVFHDITLQKKIEEALRRTGEELEERVAQRTAQLSHVVEELQREIHEREQAVKAQKVSESRFRAIFDTALDSVFIKDRELRYREVNAAMERLFQQPASELVGKTDNELFGEEVGHRMETDDKDVLSGKVLDRESTKAVCGVSHVFHVIKVPMKDSSGNIVGICGIARDVTQRKAGEEELRESRERLRLLTASLESSREEESKRISREIHDELGQNLTAAKYEVASLRKAIPRDHPELESRLDSLNRRLDSVTEDVKRIARNLRPPLLDHFGLEAALECLAGDFQQRTGIQCKCQLGASSNPIEETTATSVFRMCQEALTNVARHSKAGLVELTLFCDRDQLIVQIADDGRGITTEELRKPTLGLLGMEERARRLGGQLQIGPAGVKGTKVEIVIPLRRA